jgi:hypothetical protein
MDLAVVFVAVVFTVTLDFTFVGTREPPQVVSLAVTASADNPQSQGKVEAKTTSRAKG